MSEWTMRQLGDIVSLEYGSALGAESRTGDGYCVYGSNGVIGYHESALVAGPGIIIGRKGSIGALQWSEDDFWPIDTTYWVRPKIDLDLRWLYESLKSIGLEHLNSATGVPGLNRADAYGCLLLVPPLEEQREVAEVFQAIDSAISQCEEQRDKLRQLRIGLTADLLSGRVRTVAE